MGTERGFEVAEFWDIIYLCWSLRMTRRQRKCFTIGQTEDWDSKMGAGGGMLGQKG